MCCNTEFYHVGENPIYRYWAPIDAATHGFKMVLRPTAAAMRGFTMVLFTVSRRNNLVGGTCDLPSALLVNVLQPPFIGTFICLSR